ncbi:MAG: HAD-IIB family hydrolase [Kiritimatiellae bacterium]|nr:HAD-IIB family hydrolase [Kiritimatiellia bacterium]
MTLPVSRKPKLAAFDLDGTLTQHKTPLSAEARDALDALRASGVALMMAGAGDCRRIFRQMGGYPIDVVGNYGMQYAEWDAAAGGLRFVRDECVPCDRAGVLARADAFRAAHGLLDFAGDSVEFHDSGVVTFAILGTKARQEDKLAYDPDRRKRRAMHAEVKALFPEFTVFVGGSSSFDMAPAPFDKAWALAKACEERGLRKEDVLYVGDDYGPGGNDESVLLAGFPFLKIDDYRDTPALLRETARLP